MSKKENSISKKENPTPNKTELKGVQKVVPIILVAVALFLSICLFLDMGTLGHGMRLVLRGLFSWGSVMIPISLIAGAISYKDDVINEKKAWKRVVFSIVAIILASCVDYAIFSWSSEPVFAPLDSFKNMNFGGIVGGSIGFLLSKLFGNLGSIIICSAVLLIYAIFFFAEKAGALGQGAIKIMEFFKKVTDLIKEKKTAYNEKKKQIKEDAEQHAREVASEELIDDEFFKAKGEGADIKIRQLGIDENATTHGLSPLTPHENVVVEETPINEAEPERKRKRSEKPLDLTYGIKEEPAEETAKEPEPEKKEPSKFASGLDDTADNVFTKDFDPFDFATSEKASAKYASKVGANAAITEELDELTLYEMRANHVPTEKEKRMMELERKKQEWMRTHPGSKPSPAPAASSVNPEPVKEEKIEVPSALAPSSAIYEAPKAESVLPSTNASYERTSLVNTPVRVSAPAGYPKTTYNQPIKTVEFTISKGTVPPIEEPIESEEVSITVDKNQKHDEAEDIAILISQRIAQSNPAYARSANDLKTYTKIVSDENDELFRQLQGIHEPEKEEIKYTSSTDNTANTQSNNVTIDNYSSDRSDNEQKVDNSDTLGQFTADYDVDDESELVLSDDDEKTVTNIASVAEKAVVDAESESITNVDSITEEPSDLNPDDTAETEPEVDYGEVASSVNENAADALPESVEFSIGNANAPAEPSIQSTYQRAAGFASAMVNEVVPTPEFKPYTPPVIPVVPINLELREEEPTLKVERSMLPPTPEAIFAQTEIINNNNNPQNEASAEENPVNTEINAQISKEIESDDAPYNSPEIEVPASEGNSAVVTFSETSDSEIDFAPVDEARVEEESSNVDENTSEPDFTPVDEYKNEETESYGEDTDNVDFDDDEEEENEVVPEPEEDDEITEIPPEEQNPEVARMRGMFTVLDPIEPQKTVNMPAAESKAEVVISEPEIDTSDVPFDEPVQVKMSSTSLVLANEKKAKKEQNKPDYSSFEFPPLDFLSKQESSHDDNIQAEIQENADKLIETLASFGVTASIKGVDRGPRITRYEVVPAKGVKVSSILNLQDDIALNLAAGSIRMEAPIPGKSAVGIEIPNKKSSIVRLRDLLETPDFISEKSKTFVCIGRDVAGQPVFGDLAKMPHLLIAGATGMGKSVCINALLISVLYKARPDEVKFIMIDPKQVEFTMYNGIPHLLVPVVSDPKQAAGALMWAVEEMERRYNLLNPLCVRNIDAYNEKVTQDPSLGERLPKIIIVIDEFADLMLQVKDPVEALVTRIAQKARAAGIHLVIGTQRPSVNVITGVIKANVPSRISCKVMSNVDSKTVLDSAGAEKLLDRGDALYAPSGSPKPHRLQCAFVADSEVETVMNYLKQFSNGDSYDSSVMEDIERAAQKCNKKGGGADRDDSDTSDGSGEGYLNDRQFLDAVEIAVNTRKISTSLIQRKLSIGYGKAAKFIDIMEDMGIVGEAHGQRPREVLLSPDEWREKLARASLD